MSEVDKKLESLHNDWCTLFKEVLDKRYDMSLVNQHANKLLADSVDNDMSAVELGSMLEEFSNDRFGSNQARNFLKHICEKIFSANAEWRKTVICVNIEGSASYDEAVCHIACDDSHIDLTFVDTATNKAFIVSVPVKENVQLDFARMPDFGMGKYMLICINNKNPTNIVEHIKNPSVVAAVVAKAINLKKPIDDFMSGKFDDGIAAVSAFDIDNLTSMHEWSMWQQDEDYNSADYEQCVTPTDLLFKNIDRYSYSTNVNNVNGWGNSNGYRYLKNLVVD